MKHVRSAEREIRRMRGAVSDGEAVKPSLLPPPALTASVIEVEGDSFALFEWPVQQVRLPENLTRAEREVAELVIAGLSNRAIARTRNRAERTIANQVASLYRKLGVGSRFALSAAARKGGR